jgi:hypothetical protein
MKPWILRHHHSYDRHYVVSMRAMEATGHSHPHMPSILLLKAPNGVAMWDITSIVSDTSTG